MLQPVQSSNIAAAGYLPEERVMLIRYRDGALYAHVGVTEAAWDEFQRATSKGTWLRSTACNRPTPVLIQKDAATPAPPVAPAGASLLQTYQDDDCCGPKISKFLQTPDALKSTGWTCPKCDTEWSRRMEGEVRHWFPQVHTFIMKGTV